MATPPDAIRGRVMGALGATFMAANMVAFSGGHTARRPFGERRRPLRGQIVCLNSERRPTLEGLDRGEPNAAPLREQPLGCDLALGGVPNAAPQPDQPKGSTSSPGVGETPPPVPGRNP